MTQIKTESHVRTLIKDEICKAAQRPAPPYTYAADLRECGGSGQRFRAKHVQQQQWQYYKRCSSNFENGIIMSIILHSTRLHAELQQNNASNALTPTISC